jgi:hypothetical protein
MNVIAKHAVAQIALMLLLMGRLPQRVILFLTLMPSARGRSIFVPRAKP